jgi:NhaP-type Na+/H+ or K+/H+ antiporter
MALEFALLVILFAALVVTVTFLSHIFLQVTRLPRLIFYIIIGLLVGPLGFSFLNPTLFATLDPDGQILRAIIGVAVAIIVFEGGYSFNRCLPHEDACSPIEFRTLIRNVLRLSLIGGFLTASLMTLVFLIIAGFSLPFALLMGALTMITGPTVINPCVRRLGIKEEVAFTLEGEGLINDALGVIIASGFFSAILASISGSPFALPLVVAFDLTVGILTGLGIGAGGVIVSQWLGPRFVRRFKDRCDQAGLEHLSRIGMLVAAFSAYAIAEFFAHETGIIAALIAGILIGNRDRLWSQKSEDWQEMTFAEMDLKHHIEKGVHAFQSDLVQLAIATVFLLLTAFLTWDLLIITLFTPFFLAGIIVVILLMLIIRPLAIMASTIGTQFNIRERLFMSFFGPRGIVIAATGVFIAVTLDLRYGLVFPQIPGFIFLIVLITVIIQAGFASYTAKACKVCTVQYAAPNGSREFTELKSTNDD